MGVRFRAEKGEVGGRIRTAHLKLISRQKPISSAALADSATAELRTKVENLGYKFTKECH